MCVYIWHECAVSVRVMLDNHYPGIITILSWSTLLIYGGIPNPMSLSKLKQLVKDNQKFSLIWKKVSSIYWLIFDTHCSTKQH